MAEGLKQSHTIQNILLVFTVLLFNLHYYNKKNCGRKVLKTSAQQPLQNIVAYNFFNSVSKLNLTHQLSNTSLSTPKKSTNTKIYCITNTLQIQMKHMITQYLWKNWVIQRAEQWTTIFLVTLNLVFELFHCVPD